jgi:hypothetical protein
MSSTEGMKEGTERMKGTEGIPPGNAPTFQKPYKQAASDEALRRAVATFTGGNGNGDREAK